MAKTYFHTNGEAIEFLDDFSYFGIKRPVSIMPVSWPLRISFKRCIYQTSRS